MKTLYTLCTIAISSIMLTACGNKQQENKTFDRNEILTANDRIDTNSVYNSGDTAEVIRLTHEYLDYLKGNNYDAALSMLSDVKTQTNTVSALSDEQAKRLMRKMELFPVENYDINDVKFYSDKDTEVSYTINKNEAAEGPSTAMKCILCFRKINGQWYATVLDSDYTR